MHSAIEAFTKYRDGNDLAWLGGLIAEFMESTAEIMTGTGF